MATIWVLDDPRWRVDDSRPSRASTVSPRDGVTPPAADRAEVDDRSVVHLEGV